MFTDHLLFQVGFNLGEKQPIPSRVETARHICFTADVRLDLPNLLDGGHENLGETPINLLGKRRSHHIKTGMPSRRETKHHMSEVQGQEISFVLPDVVVHP